VPIVSIRTSVLPSTWNAAGATALRVQPMNSSASPQRIALIPVTGTPMSSNCTAPMTWHPPP